MPQAGCRNMLSVDTQQNTRNTSIMKQTFNGKKEKHYAGSKIILMINMIV